MMGYAAIYHDGRVDTDTRHSLCVSTGCCALTDSGVERAESPATKKTKRKTSLAASIGKKLLGTSKSKVEEVDDAEKSEGEGAREALAGARRPKAKKGELTMTVRQLTALQSQLQVRHLT